MYPVRCLPQRMSFRRHFMERDPPKRKSGASPKERNKSMKKILNVEEMKNMKKIVKILILSCTVTLLAALTACSDNVSDTIRSDSAAETAADDSQGTSGEVNNGADETSESEEKIEAVDFEVTLVTGETVKLSDYKGKKVLLNFWATWCGPCIQEMPAFQRLWEDYPDDFVLLAVNCGETEDEVKAFVEENGYTFHIALDEDLAVSSIYPASSIPLNIIVDEEGYITYAKYGAYDEETTYEHYKELLELE